MLEAGGDVGLREGLEDVGVALRVAAPRRRDADASRSASSTAASAAGTSTASRTRRRAGREFDWFRGRMLGGRTNHWGRISLRFGPDDFKRTSLDGLGDDWPISYDDIKPYYDKLDALVGIFGSIGRRCPNEPDGIFLPPPKPRCYELLIKQACRQAATSPASRRGCRSSRSR